MVSYGGPSLASGRVAQGETITVQSSVGTGRFSDDEVVLMVGANDHSLCFGGSKWSTVSPGMTLKTTVTIPQNFQGVVAAGIELAAPRGPCDSWLEGLGILKKNKLGAVGERLFDPGRVQVVGCRAGNPTISETGGSFEVTLDVENDNDQAAEAGLEIDIGSLDKATQTFTIPANTVKTVTREFALIGLEVSNMGGPGDYAIGNPRTIRVSQA